MLLETCKKREKESRTKKTQRGKVLGYHTTFKAYGCDGCQGPEPAEIPEIPRHRTR